MLVETGVGRLFVEVVGDGPDIVLWHSFLCDGGMWRPQVRALESRFRLLNIDGPGHGRSGPLRRGFTLDDCVVAGIEVMNAARAERAGWLGLSWGGMVGMRLAARHPERVAALALLDTSARRTPLLERPRHLAMLAVARTVGFVPPLARAIEAVFFTEHTRRARPELTQYLRERAGAMDKTALVHAANAIVLHRSDVTAELGQIETPTLVMVGEEDRATSPAESELLAREIRGARLVRIPDAAHLSTLEQPQRVNAELLAFFEQHVHRHRSAASDAHGQQ